MRQLAVSIAGGTLIGAIALCVLGLIGWAAGSVAGLSLSFHSGISELWIPVFVAALLGSGIAASVPNQRFADKIRRPWRGSHQQCLSRRMVWPTCCSWSGTHEWPLRAPACCDARRA